MNSSTPPSKPENQLRDMNEALLVSSAHQHELAEKAEIAHELVRLSEARFRGLFDSAPMAVFVCDQNAVIQNFNARAAELWGREPECGVEQHCGSTKLWLPDGTHLPHARSPVVDVLRTGIPAMNVEVFIERPDGSRLPVLVNFAPLKIDSGAVTGAITSFIDIAERKRAEEALRESEARKSAVVNTALDGIITIDHEGQVIEFNPAAEAIFGYRCEDVLGREMAELIIPVALRDKHRRGLARYLATGEGPILCQRLELTALRSGGAEFPAEVTITRINMAGPPLFTGYIRDITERKRTEKAIRDSEERFRDLADNIPQLAWIADAGSEGQVHWFNRNWYEYTGSTLAEMKGSGWQAVHHPDHAERVVRKFAHHVREGLDWEDTFPLRGKDGEYRWFLSRMKVIRDESGAVVRIFGTNTDVTEQRVMADKLRQYAADMSEADRRKNEFLAMLGHELRNPLAPISNAVQLLGLRENEDPLQQQARAIIERQAAQLTHLVDDLMEVSRITTGRIQLRLDRLIVNGIVEHAIETARPMIEQHRHEFTVSLPPEPIWLDVDAARLEQVVVNLLANAAKYTPDGGHIWLSVELASRERERAEECVLRVRDTGVGIAPELLPHIFDLFTQAERSLDRSQGGLGIGLALVHRLVEMHQGRVEVYSVLGQGSEFVVRLPVAPIAAPRPPATLPETAAPHGPALRVLVVDDNQDSAMSLTMLLKASGHDVVTAHDGPTGLQMALESRPTAVLLDIGLPGLNGYEVAKRIRQQPAGDKVLLIALTGYGNESDQRLSKEAGFDHHLVKPVRFSKVQSLLAAIAERT